MRASGCAGVNSPARVLSCPLPADLALAILLQAEEDNALAAQLSGARASTSSRGDSDAGSRMRADEAWRASEPDLAVVWRRKGKRNTGPTKHDPVVCGRQNARHLERVSAPSTRVGVYARVCLCVPVPVPVQHYSDSMGSFTAGQRIDNATFNSLRSFLSKKTLSRRPTLRDAASEDTVRRLQTAGDIDGFTCVAVGSDATVFRATNWRSVPLSPCCVCVSACECVCVHAGCLMQ